MIKSLMSLAALTLAASSTAQEAEVDPSLPDLTMEQETALRCGVAFALVQNGKVAGDASVQDYPEPGERGREFFVRTTAQLMEQTGANREAVGMLVIREVKSLKNNPQALREIMPACMMMLDASGL